MASSEADTDTRRTAADCTGSRQVCVGQTREIIKPTVMELSKEVRTNILCTVEGCGKILPNTPALNMHLVKSHRIQVDDGYIWTGIGLQVVPHTRARTHTRARVTSNWSRLFFFSRCHANTESKQL